jgi:hypothetical protein
VDAVPRRESVGERSFAMCEDEEAGHGVVSDGRMGTMNERTEAQQAWTDLRTALWTRSEPMFLWFGARPWVLVVMAGMAIGLMVGSALMGWIEVSPRFLKD